MARNSTKVVVDRTGQVVAGILLLTGHRVMVGVPDSKDARRNDDGGNITNSELAYIHENGAPEVNIPARPFMVPGIAAAQGQINERLLGAAEAAFAGRPDQVMKQLNAVGLLAQSAIKRKITTGPFVPLAPRTLAGRRRRGRTGTKPLIDTGQLRQAITYVIRRIAGRRK